MSEQAVVNSELNTISEAEFIKLCDDIYADRWQIYEFNPNASHREALLWMLTGCLISLLDASVSEQTSADDYRSADPYSQAIREMLENRTQPHFDPHPHLARLLKKIEEEQPDAV
jgi:hypothetical protein